MTWTHSHGDRRALLDALEALEGDRDDVIVIGAQAVYMSPPDVGPRERELLLDAFDSNWIAPLGPRVDALEEELAAATGRQHCAALASGTAALHLGLKAMGVGPGDVVITAIGDALG